MKTLLAPASLDDLIRLLRAWRFWVFGALIGGLIGAAYYFVRPPDYRARATVVVSFNMEKAWPNKPDNELFYYLERESRKLQEVAWSDATLQQLADQTGFTVLELRPSGGKLELSQPQDGGWHFYASDPSATIAASLASTWAQIFTAQVRQGIQTAVTLDATRKALENNPADIKLQQAIKDLESRSLAITPEIQISLSQSGNYPDIVPTLSWDALLGNLPTGQSRKSSPGVYIMAGAGLLLALASFGILVAGKGNQPHA